MNNELYTGYAKVIEMCKNTVLEDFPWKGVTAGLNGFSHHPTFMGHPSTYKFATSIENGEFVFDV